MSLYRTWRPRSFSELVGQDSVVRTLASALDSGKIAHAYLFSGPRGSGKTSAAKIMARCLNCVTGPNSTPDNTCEYCRAILDGTALDVLEIDAASNRGIDEIRALRDAVKFAASAMRYKVYIIDEAHMLTKEGANAFLKTLEEPPPHVVFILATTEPEKLPVTILSRCQRYAFRRIAVPVMIDRMRTIAREENINVDDSALAAIAYRADGGLRDALTMLEQAAAFAGTSGGSSCKIEVATLDLAFGATGRNYAHGLIDAVLARDASATLRAVEEASEAGADMHVLLRALTAEFRNLLVARVDPDLLARDLTPDDAQTTARRAAVVPQTAIVRAMRLLADAGALARSSGNPRLELETALLRFVLAREDSTLEALSARLAALESGEPGGRPNAAVPVPAKPVLASERAGHARPASRPETPAAPTAQDEASNSGPLPSVQKVRAAWEKIRSRAESERPSLRAPLSNAAVEMVDGRAIVLSMRDKVSGDILREHAKLLEAAVADVLGAPLRITCKVDAAKSGARSTSKSGAPAGEDPDELFAYANERIQKR